MVTDDSRMLNHYLRQQTHEKEQVWWAKGWLLGVLLVALNLSVCETCNDCCQVLEK